MKAFIFAIVLLVLAVFNFYAVQAIAMNEVRNGLSNKNSQTKFATIALLAFDVIVLVWFIWLLFFKWTL